MVLCTYDPEHEQECNWETCPRELPRIEWADLIHGSCAHRNFIQESKENKKIKKNRKKQAYYFSSILILFYHISNLF